MSNVTILDKKVKSLGYSLGCKNNIDLVPKSKLSIILDALDSEYTDVFFTIRNKLYVAEISTVGREKDITVRDGFAYFSEYDNLDEALEVGKITEEQYNSIKDC